MCERERNVIINVHKIFNIVLIHRKNSINSKHYYWYCFYYYCYSGAKTCQIICLWHCKYIHSIQRHSYVSWNDLKVVSLLPYHIWWFLWGEVKWKFWENERKELGAENTGIRRIIRIGMNFNTFGFCNLLKRRFTVISNYLFVSIDFSKLFLLLS